MSTDLMHEVLKGVARMVRTGKGIVSVEKVRDKSYCITFDPPYKLDLCGHQAELQVITVSSTDNWVELRNTDNTSRISTNGESLVGEVVKACKDKENQ
jgi:hypothetical protein